MDEAILGTRRNLIGIGSRAKNQIPRFYGTPSLTESKPPTCQDAYGNRKGIYTLHSAQVQAALLVHRKEKTGWISQGELYGVQTIKKVKKCLEQRTGPLPDSRDPRTSIPVGCNQPLCTYRVPRGNKSKANEKRLLSHVHVQLKLGREWRFFQHQLN